MPSTDDTPTFWRMCIRASVSSALMSTVLMVVILMQSCSAVAPTQYKVLNISDTYPSCVAHHVGLHSFANVNIAHSDVEQFLAGFHTEDSTNCCIPLPHASEHCMLEQVSRMCQPLSFGQAPTTRHWMAGC